MSGFASKLQMSSFFNRSGYAGPRRFLVIGGIATVVLGAIVVVSFSGATPPPQSLTARMPGVNPLPGGLNSTPNQDKLSLLTNQEQADQAAQQGRSYSPPIPASHPTTPAVVPPWTPQAQPVSARMPDPNASLRVVVPPPRVVAPEVHYTADPAVRPVALTYPQQQIDPNEQKHYDDAVNRLLRGWNGQVPRTDVVLQPAQANGADATSAGGPRAGGFSFDRDSSSAGGGSGQGSRGRLIMPAGRGVFAHTVLAVDSDGSGPIVLQADSGPLAGDRMIGTFAKAGGNNVPSDRLVVRVNSVEHQGRSIAVDAIVTAPDTMETTVASSVDEHYLSRFVLPAAAAFVQGLGTALATTSNTVGVLSPLGGTSFATQLNFPQQLGVGAGVAAGQVASTLQQQAPRGPTIHLAANANVGVMFLADVTSGGNY